MMPWKSLLNPNAAPFVPLLKNLPEMRHEGHDEASKKTSGISDSSGDVGMAESCQASGSASVQNIQSMQKLQVSDEISSEADEFNFSDEEHDTMNDLDSLSSMFPDYSRESLIGLYYANQGDLMETVYALRDLESGDGGGGGGGDDDDYAAAAAAASASASEELPATSEAINNLAPPCLKSDSAGASSSTSSAHSVHKADF